MRRDNLGDDFAFIDRFLKDLAPKAYRPDESWDLPELTLDRVFVGRHDVNEDGRDELFVYAQYSCGTVGCPTGVFARHDGEWVPLFSDLAVLGDTTLNDEWVIVMDVWTDPESGHKTIFSYYEGFRWTGKIYEYVGGDEVVEVSALMPPDFGGEGGCVVPRPDGVGHLTEYLATKKPMCLIYDPTVKSALDELMGREFLHLRKNLDRRPTIDYYEGNLVIEGSRRPVHGGGEERVPILTKVAGDSQST